MVRAITARLVAHIGDEIAVFALPPSSQWDQASAMTFRERLLVYISLTALGVALLTFLLVK